MCSRRLTEALSVCVCVGVVVVVVVVVVCVRGGGVVVVVVVCVEVVACGGGGGGGGGVVVVVVVVVVGGGGGGGCGGGGGLGDWTEAWTFFAEIVITFVPVRTRSASITRCEWVAVGINWAIGYKSGSVSTEN